jgi:hypothetical protein
LLYAADSQPNPRCIMRALLFVAFHQIMIGNALTSAHVVRSSGSFIQFVLRNTNVIAVRNS